jgi:hypothetical protein
LDWKDTLLPGSSRVALPWQLNGPTLPGYAGDSFNQDPNQGYQQRNDWVMGPGGVPVISGSSEQQGVGTPSPGFSPVDAGQYGGNPWFAGRGGAAPSLTGAAVAPSGALGQYGQRSAAELQALLRALSQLDLGSLVGGARGGGGLRIPE